MRKLFFQKKFWLFYFFVCIFLKLQAQDIDNIIHSKPFKIKGSASLQGIYMQQPLNGSLRGSTSPFNFIATGSPTISIYGFDIPLQFIFSPQAAQFQQPFNQFSLSPHYKWATAYLGYQNLSYHPYTLSGHTIYGAGFEISPKKLKLGIMYGRFAKASAIDTITQTLQPASFSRKGFAAHLGLGSAKTFVDFSLVSAKDDSTSLGLSKSNLDTLSKKFGQYIQPSANVVVGVNCRLNLFKNMFVEGVGAVSLFTRDVRNNVSIDTGDYKEIIQKINQFIPINLTSEYYKAYQTAVGYAAKNWSLKLQYQHIDPGYQSMGAYYINNDVENYTISPSVFLFKRKLSIASSVGFQNDNLNGMKSQTSSRIISSIAINALMSKHFNVSANYSNYNINLTPTAQRIADTLRVVQNNKNFSITPIYNFLKGNTNNTIVICFNANNMNDYNNMYAVGKQYRIISSYLAFINYKVSFVKQNIGVQTGLNYNNIITDGLQDNNLGLTLGYDQLFLHKKLAFSIVATYLNGERNNNSTSTVNSSLQMSYQISKNNSFSIRGGYNNTNIAGNSQNISYTRIDAGYSIQF